MTLERWRQFSKRDQIGHIAAEIKRAILAKKEDAATRRMMLERVLEFIDISLQDPKWHDERRQLLALRDGIAEAYEAPLPNLQSFLAAL